MATPCSPSTRVLPPHGALSSRDWKKAGIAVVDKDRSAGLFFTRLNLPEKRAKNSRRRTARQQTQRVQVETQGSTTRVRLEKAANTPLDARVSAVILKHLKRYMN